MPESVNSSPKGSLRKEMIESLYGLSGLQQGMLFHSIYENNSEAYIEQFSCELKGVNAEIFTKTWAFIIEKHTVLRTGFFHEAFSVPIQCVFKQAKLPIEWIDYTDLSKPEQEKAIQQFDEQDLKIGFDLENPPLMRVGMIKISEDTFRMLWTSHHILFDGWSVSVLMKAFMETYQHFTEGASIPFKEVDKFEDYIRYIDSKDKSQEKEFWKNYLLDIENSTLLPFIKKNAERNMGKGSYRSLEISIGGNRKNKIEQFVKFHHLTPNTLMQGVWAFLLHTYTASKDIVYGITVSGRPEDLVGVESRVGLYINTLVLRSKLNEDITCLEWLQNLQTEQLSTREFQYSTLHEVQAISGVKGDLFDTLLVYENYPFSKIGQSGTNSLQIDNVSMHEHTNYPLTITAGMDDEISIGFSYNDNLLETDYVLEISKHFEFVLDQMTLRSDIRLKDIDLQTDDQKAKLLKEFNISEKQFDLSNNLIELFELQVVKTPHEIALNFENDSLTYLELNQRANQLASFLRKHGVAEETLVPLCIKRGMEMIVGMLGILKSGGAYVPIDIEYPIERIAFMLQDCQAQVIVSDGISVKKLKPLLKEHFSTKNIKLIELDDTLNEIVLEPATNQTFKILSNNLAYVIYTSGSTGKPKGVMVEHHSLLNYVLFFQDYFKISSTDSVIQQYSIAFDACVEEIYPTLISGAQLTILKEGGRDISELKHYIESGKVTVLSATPLILEYLNKNLSHLGKLRFLVVGGDMLHASSIDFLFKNIRIVNGYGPSETTVAVTVKEITNLIEASIIGKPVSNTQIYILDQSRNPVPLGVAGEIYIAGEQVARGYLNQEQLSSEKFLIDPYSNKIGARMYRTGDTGRWLANGDIDFIGRIDEQVKIRGYRVELGEVESILNNSGFVSQALILAKQYEQGIKRLVAYFIPKTGISKNQLIQFMRSMVPDYMVPSVWMEMTSFPLNQSGKVNRKALPDPDNSLELQYTAPQNETEQSLVQIWQELLGNERIGIDDNFFELGGHSLIAMRLISTIRKKLNLELTVKDLFQNPSVKELAIAISNKVNQELLPVILSQTRPNQIPLSFSQERLWFIDKLEGSLAYHIPAVLFLNGDLNKSALTLAFRKIVDRHEVLRTNFLDSEGAAFQIVNSSDNWKLRQHDLTSVEADSLSLQLINQPFDLSKDYMLRCDLINLSDKQHKLVIVMHHIASDGWSVSLIVNELVALYKHFNSNSSLNLPTLKIQYADYAIWQRNQIQGQYLDSKLTYWKQKLANVIPLNLPTDFQRSIELSSEGASHHFEIDDLTLSKLKKLSSDTSSSLFMVLMAAFKVLLYRYTQQEDICIGTPVSGRQYQETENLIGFFVNTLAIRTQISPDKSFDELISDVRTNTLEAFDYQDVPFEKVVEAIVKERDLRRSPIFQVLFALQNTPEVPELVLGDLVLDIKDIESATSKFELSLTMAETPTGLEAMLDYRLDLFKPETIKRFSVHFQELLDSLANESNQPIANAIILPEVESQQLLRLGIGPEIKLSLSQSIVSLFEQQVLQNPNKTALVFENLNLSYKQLNELSNQVANLLISKGVKPNSSVPFYLNRGHQMIMAMLGIMKSGAAYLPLDSEFKDNRINYVLNDCATGILLSEKSLVRDYKGIEVIPIDSDLVLNQSTANPEVNIKSSDLAYVIYTSGSTGFPKGVMIEHANILDYFFGLNSNTDLSLCSSHALVSSIATDLGNTVIFGSLLNGATLHVFSGESVSNSFFMLNYFAKHTIDCLKIVPSHWQALCEDSNLLLPNKLLIFGGELLSGIIVNSIRKSGYVAQVINHYGPTETTIGKLLYITEPDRFYEGNIPIGRPFSNTSVYVLKNQMQLSPLGVSGELFIGGNGLSRGYLNNTELTDSRFIRNPFSKETSLIYSTGDLVKWLSDGNIEYLGRLDDQLKIRGFRIEPGEIESAIAGSKLTKQSVVIARTDQSGSKRLIAYVVGNKMYQKQELLNYLRSKLPDYMIPSVIMELASIPLTANGKVDKRALPEVEHNQSKQYVAPSNEMQRQLCVIWQELLELKQVGITDNFFELGGHSLLAMRVISLVRRQLGIELRVKDLFKYPSIAELSKQLSRQKHGTLLPAIDKQERPAHIPLSFSQERLWFIDQLEGSIQYHIPAVLELKGKLNIEALNFGFKEIINRHEILRTSIVQYQGQAYQQIHASLEWQIEQIKDYKTQTQAEAESSIKALINQPYDLSKDSMLRAYLIERTDQDHILVVTLHHIVSDGWSTSIIVNELAELYRSFEQKVPVLLKTLQIQYADYAIWQRNYIQGELLDTKLAYWKQKLQNASPLELPTDYARPAVQGVRGLTEEFEIEASLTQQIKQLSQNSNTTVFMTLLSAFKVMLYRYTNQQDITVGTPIAGRQQLETESLIGYFVNTLALRSDLSSQTKFSELLAQVRTTTLEAYEHQEIPFEKVVEAVVKERDLSRSPLFQVMFVMNNTPEVTGIKLGDVETTEYRFKNDMTQFDLSMTITQINGKMDASIEYCTDLYKTGSIRRMVQHYLELLKSIVQNPDKEVGGLRMLSYTEQNQILREFNTTATAYPQDKLVTELFETQAAASPQKIALSFENEQISYQELNAKSNQLAHYLRQRGAKAEMLIPICLERGPKMIIGILGILKSGAAYVPIDSDYPQSRISYILNDTEARLVVSDPQIKAKIIGRQTEIIDIESDWSEIAKQPETNLERTVGLNNLAYLIYTSGSTGEPKGVMIEHKSLLNYVLFFKEYLEINSQDGITQQNSIAFDTSIEEIFPTLVSGATLFVMKEGGRDLDKIKKEIESGKVTIVTTTPLFIDALNKDIDKTGNLRHVVSGGDVLRPSAIDKLITQVNIVNGYGPSETTIAVVFKRVLNLADAAQIGKPIPNVKIYILDDSLNPLPIGVYGEICVSGVQVARGYFNNPEITATKFVVDPFDEQKTERIYKTGDIGRWLEDGNIEFYGRKDEQVKIRGFRIELGEIESVLNLSPMVEHGAVLAVELPNGSKRLVAYIVPNSTFNKDKLITDLQQTLPEFMVPATWIMLDSIPLNSNGKIDRKALPEPDMSLQINENYSAPQTSTEKVMAKIWQELLGIEQIGVHDNFFESGGDSILTIQVVSRARRAGFNINTRDLFTYQSIHKLCEAISNRTKLETKEADEKVFGTSGLLPIQTWFLEKPHKNPSHYNQSVFLKIDKQITPDSLELVAKNILNYHDALRFSYVKKTTNWVQEYQDVQGQLFVEDFSKVSKKNFANTLLEITDKYQKSLNIEQGDLVKFVWIKTPKLETENRLFICIHHLVVDGVSWRILLEDFEILLNQIQNNEPLNLGQKSSSFKHWFESLKQYGESENLNLQRSFWSKTVEGYVPLSIDTGYNGPVYTKDIFTISVQLNSSYTRQLLQEISKVYSTEINDILLAALALTFNKKYKYPKIVIGLEGHGREEFPDSPDTSRTVGWFTTLFPICLEIAPDQSPDYYIKSVKEQLRKVPAKGLGYGILKSIIQADELKGRDPWDIVFNYLGQFDNAVSNSRWFKTSTEQVAADVDDHFEIAEKVSVNSYVQDNVLTVNWNASNLHFKNETIQNLANDFIDNLKLLIDDCTINKQKQFKTPSDFGLGDDIEFVEFDEFLSEPCQGKTRREWVSGVYRLSGMQQGMLFHSLYDEKSDAYIEQFICDIFNVESELFERSWKQVIDAHSALRTGFFNNNFSIPVQSIFKDVKLPIKWLDFSNLNDQDITLIEYQQNDKLQGFDFENAPLMRVSMIKLTESKYRMIWTSHHILFDGWSVPIMMEQFLTSYQSFKINKSPSIQIKDNYEDYVLFLDSQNKEDEQNFWRKYLKNLEVGILLPFSNSGFIRNKGLGDYASIYLEIKPETKSKTETFIRKNRLTMSTLMQGVWAKLLHTYTGLDDIIFGVTVSGRPENLPDVEERVGLYINTLPLRSKINKTSEIISWLKNVQDDQVSARLFQFTALHEIQKVCQIHGDLFDSILVYENYPVSKVIEAGAWDLKVENVSLIEKTNYPLTISVSGGQDLSIGFTFNSAIFDSAYIQMIRLHFERVLMQIIEGKTKQISDLELLSLSEKDQILSENNLNRKDYSGTETLVSLVELQASKTPNATALVFGSQTLTYQALNEKSNQLAHYLMAKGVQSEELVPLCVARGFEMIIGILGILKSGGAYVPIDGSYPKQRIDFMLKDTKAKRVVSDQLSTSKAFEIINPIKDWSLIEKQPITNPSYKPKPGNLAYIIYTSGSTGQPKGVMIEHQGVVNLIKSQSEYFNIESNERILQFSNYSFDASVEQIFLALSNGASLVLFEEGLQLKSLEFETYLEEQKITHFHATPGFIENLNLENHKHLKRIIAGGDWCKAELANRYKHQVDFYNEYGPTETTVTAIEYKSDKLDNRTLLPIGKALANTSIYILDESEKLQPIGVVGEIYIGGVQVARGYLNNEELTAQKFILNPFNPNERLYKTGDLGKWLPDGNIEFLGRKDDQVKIRGYRIELGEIESAIEAGMLTEKVAVIAVNNQQNTKQLIAVVVAKSEFSKEKMIAWLRQEIPEYMIPSIWVEVPEIPLTSNGKVDKKALSDLNLTKDVRSKYVAPTNEVEEKLANIWSDLLNIENPGIEDDFFEMGGHSILATRLVSAIRKEFNLNMPIKLVFEFTTIKQLGDYIKLALSSFEKPDEDSDIFEL